MATWPAVRIGSLGRIVTGRTPTSQRPELFGNEFPFITPSDLEYDRPHISTERFLSVEGYDNQGRLLLPKQSVCFTCIGATIGKLCITKSPSFTNQQINSIVVDESNHDAAFVFYLLRYYHEHIASTASGAATPLINKTAFSNFEVEVPPFVTQRKIAAILSGYDDLIENNTRRIAILEEMAQAIYREWFVNFRFPGYENVKPVDSPLGQIPEGWEVVRVGSLLKRLRARKQYKQADVTEDGRVPVIDQSTAELLGFHDNLPDFEASLAKPVVVFGDHTCKMELMTTPFSIGPNVVPFVCKTEHSVGFVFYAVKSLISTQEYKRHWTELNNKDIHLGPCLLTDEFAATISPMVGEVALLRQKNRALRTTCDLLLPKLISGKLDVENVDIDVGEPLEEAEVAA